MLHAIFLTLYMDCALSEIIQDKNRKIEKKLQDKGRLQFLSHLKFENVTLIPA